MHAKACAPRKGAAALRSYGTRVEINFPNGTFTIVEINEG